MVARSSLFRSLRYYPPEKQGLRLPNAFTFFAVAGLRYYPPEKQGLRQTVPKISLKIEFSDTILQKNKD